MLVIDAVVSGLYSNHGVRVYQDGVVHRLSEFNESANRWWTCCDQPWGRSGAGFTEHDTEDDLTCIGCIGVASRLRRGAW